MESAVPFKKICFWNKYHIGSMSISRTWMRITVRLQGRHKTLKVKKNDGYFPFIHWCKYSADMI